MQLRILTNHTDKLLQVFLRPVDVNLGIDKYGDPILPRAPPPPLWFQDEVSGSMMATASTDLNRCQEPDNLLSCPYTYWIDLDKSERRSYFWVGVVGRFDYAKHVPFEFSARIINTGNPVLLRSLNLSQEELNGLPNPRN